MFGSSSISNQDSENSLILLHFLHSRRQIWPERPATTGTNGRVISIISPASASASSAPTASGFHWPIGGINDVNFRHPILHFFLMVPFPVFSILPFLEGAAKQKNVNIEIITMTIIILTYSISSSSCARAVYIDMCLC
ncbi:hypothetical protein EGW08_019006 [Elysia chlorotica]|uniref:Uncharacterized protein n=1 Tax=Elysia chlorotica TaxID=188477 RepID=A0A433SVC8_ELYCH|nr:hypothetical protein EGW08_019006 [Elysia chlorotica]